VRALSYAVRHSIIIASDHNEYNIYKCVINAIIISHYSYYYYYFMYTAWTDGHATTYKIGIPWRARDTRRECSLL